MREGRGRFFALEGGEGSGKSTQAERLAARLRESGRHVVLTREPGGTPFGERLRRVLLDPASAVEEWAEVHLYAADRAAHVAAVVRPALAAGRDVVCDRFLWSSLAYQGAGRGLGVAAVEAVNLPALSGAEPDLVVVLDLPVSDGLARAGGIPDRIEAEPAAFHERVREAFLALAAERGGVVVDASLPVEEVAAAVWAAVEARGALAGEGS